MLKNYPFLEEMYEDPFYPDHLVDKGVHILINLCNQIEKDNPKDLKEFYKLIHHTTIYFNELINDFKKEDSELDIVAKDCIGENIYTIAQAYGFEDTDIDLFIDA